MNSPPAKCASCGWAGPAPGFHIEESTGISFQGSTVKCPRCGKPATINSGTYDFVGGIVRVVRDANLSLSDLNAIRAAAAHARRTGQTPEAFATAHPAAAPIVNLIVQQRALTQWLAILVAVLGIVINHLENAERQAQGPQAHARPPALTTKMLSREAMTSMERRIEHQVEQRFTGRLGGRSRPTTKRKQPKQYGQAKRKRHR